MVRLGHQGPGDAISDAGTAKRTGPSYRVDVAVVLTQVNARIRRRNRMPRAKKSGSAQAATASKKQK
jgi:hypothetical protein